KTTLKNWKVILNQILLKKQNIMNGYKYGKKSMIKIILLRILMMSSKGKRDTSSRIFWKPVVFLKVIKTLFLLFTISILTIMRIAYEKIISFIFFFQLLNFKFKLITGLGKV